VTAACGSRLCYQLRFVKVCSYFPITIWDCMDIVHYLDYAGHVSLIVMFDVVVLCHLDD
jgi:hypothetical protein